MRVKHVDDDDPSSDNITSRKRVNLFVRHAKKLACSSSLGQLGRALLKVYRIQFPIKVRRKPGQEYPEGEGHWVSSDLSQWKSGNWEVSSMCVEGRIFWVKFESYPSYENIAMKHAIEIFKVAVCRRVPYDDAIVVMKRAIESIKE